MIRLLMLLVCVVRASADLQSTNYQMREFRKSQSTAEPVESVYINDKDGNDVFEPNANLHTVNNFSDSYNKRPGILSESVSLYDALSADDTHVKHYGGDYSGYDRNLPKGKHSDKTISYSPSNHYLQNPHEFPLTHSEYSGTEFSSAITEHSDVPYSVDYEIAKSETKYNSKHLPSKIKSDVEYEKLKSAMHYRPSSDFTYDLAYNVYNDFRVDDDDIRTSSRSPYDGWPYFYHSPYDKEYDLNKNSVDNTLQKAIDKRYVLDSVVKHKIIPVYEDQEYDQPYAIKNIESTTQENPLAGEQPFLSFILNDYNEKSGDDDDLNFKGLELGQNFDYSHVIPTEETSASRQRLSRQGHNIPKSHEHIDDHLNYDEHTERYNIHESKLGDSTTEKGYSKNHEFINQEKGDKKSEEHEKAYEQNLQNQKHFKDFLESFANKFGNEKQNRNSKYALQRNQDKGEKKTGFRRVYHKDEYQEDNEFYDNINNKAHVHEDAQSSGNSGGSEAFLKSHATATTGDESNSHSNKGNTHKSNFINNHSGNDRSKGTDYDFNRYRSEAKKTAQFNNAEYPDYVFHN